MSLNSIMVTGNLGKDPVQLGESRDDGCTAVFSIAVGRWDSRQKQERTMWLNVIAFGRTGRRAMEHLSKGNRIVILGSLDCREYEDKEGRPRKDFQIIAQNFEFAKIPLADREPSSEGKTKSRREEPNYGESNEPSPAGGGDQGFPGFEL